MIGALGLPLPVGFPKRPGPPRIRKGPLFSPSYSQNSSSSVSGTEKPTLGLFDSMEMKMTKVRDRWEESPVCVGWGFWGLLQEESGVTETRFLFHCSGNVVLSRGVLLHFHKKKKVSFP